MTAAGPARHPDTVLVTSGRPAARAGEPLNVPLVAASAFRSGHDADADAGREYARTDATPTWEAFEDVVGTLEGGSAVSFSSGMAVASAIVDLVPPGGLVVVPQDSYVGVRAALAAREASGRHRVVEVDVTDSDATVPAMAAAALVWLESPTNPLLDVADLPVLCRAARAAGALVAVDNTLPTPLLQRPLALGADLVMHSATKFLGGHSDLLLGVAVAAEDDVAARLIRRRTLAGATPGALEAFLALRGMRTLGVRLRQAQEAAGELARRLADHPGVTRVRYPGLPDDPGHRTASAQMAGPGAVVSWEVADASTAARVCAGLRIAVHATSLGGVETTIERRGRYVGQEHVPPGLLRMSVGLEDVEDLWADLDRAVADARQGS
jgi:cystathionine gamma-synthase